MFFVYSSNTIHENISFNINQKKTMTEIIICQYNKDIFRPNCQFLSVPKHFFTVAHGLFIIQRNAKVTEII